MLEKNGKIYTKIIAGELKGKNIELPSLEVTRSSKSILRESVFNTLQFDIVDRTFIEVFAGSGSIGLEAISRGANFVYFIEKNIDSFNILKSNIKTLDVNNRAALFYADSFNKLPELFKELNSRSYFYFDPPFSIRDNMDTIYDDCIALIKKIPLDLIEEVIIEHMSNIDIEISTLKLKKRKKFGKSSISYYIPKERSNDE
jgi:16S rRNA (guanine(966)-N(2))-methyltransferase RsmD